MAGRSEDATPYRRVFRKYGYKTLQQLADAIYTAELGMPSSVLSGIGHLIRNERRPQPDLVEAIRKVCDYDERFDKLVLKSAIRYDPSLERLLKRPGPGVTLNLAVTMGLQKEALRLTDYNFVTRLAALSTMYAITDPQLPGANRPVGRKKMHGNTNGKVPK